jgi:hypothetical protein
MAYGRNGLLSIGNFSSTISEHDSSSPMADSCWNSILGPMDLHFLLMNCAPFSCRKARASFVGKLCSRQIPISVRVSERFKIAGQSPRLPCWAIGAVALQRSMLQLPIRTIPVEHLLKLRDVVRENGVKIFSFFGGYFALVRNNVSIFVT